MLVAITQDFRHDADMNTMKLTSTQTEALYRIGARLSDAGLRRAGIRLGTVNALRRQGLVEWAEWELNGRQITGVRRTG